MVIDENKSLYKIFSVQKQRYATAVYLLTNCVRAYIIICILSEYLFSLPSKKFIEFGQNSAPVPSIL